MVRNQEIHLDANEMASLLAMPEYGFVSRTLVKTSATRRSVKQAILDAIELADDGVLLMFLAGHGTQAPDGAYFVCADGDALEPGLDLSWLSSQLGRRPPGSTTIAMLDFCHSGALTMRGGQIVHRLTTERLSESVGGGRGRVLLAACSSDDVSFESAEAEHGVFTRWLLAGLMGGAISEDGCVTVTALFDFVCAQMESSGCSPVLQGYVEGQFSIGRGLQALWQGRTLETR